MPRGSETFTIMEEYQRYYPAQWVFRLNPLIKEGFILLYLLKRTLALLPLMKGAQDLHALPKGGL